MDGSCARTLRRGSRYGESLEPRLACAGWAATSPLVESAYLSAWQSDLADARARWQLRGLGQTVAVIDSGIAYDHPALGGGLGAGYRVVGGWDFTAENDADPYDDPPAGFHGTHVAGILASEDGTYPGVAPAVDLVALRVFDDQGKSDFRWIEKALQWVEAHRHAFRHPITTINLSLGVAPSDTAGSGNILADEFARLAEAGIFVAVAAGNGFQFDGQVALNYPASDPSVVPVGSADAQGRLSRFTRRDPRMLVAPGERITSTITDYLYDFNGKTDDFRAFSGTSQATPQVAGAAVLVREAFQRAGRTEVGPREILDVLRRSAETLGDPATGLTYARIRLRPALELVLPESERPETPSPAKPQPTALTVTRGSVLVAGRLERDGEQDRFSFVSPYRGFLHADARVVPDGRMVPGNSRLTILIDGVEADWLRPGGVELRPDQLVLVNVEGGTAGDYSWRLVVDPFEDLGRIAIAERTTNSTNGGSFRLEAARDGWLTLAVVQTGSTVESAGARLQLSDSNQQILLDVRARPDGDRWDVRVRAGDVYWVRLVDAPQGGLRLGLANVVDEDAQGGWIVDLPPEVRQLDVRLDDRLRVTLDGWELPLPRAVPRATLLHAAPASQLVFQSHRRGESLTVRDDRVEASNGRQRVTVVTAGPKEIRGRVGLDQRVQILGGPAADRFLSDGGIREFSGVSGRTVVSGVERVYVSGGGGADVAILRGSGQNDVLVSRDAWTRLVTPGFLDEVEGIARVEVDAGGGYDRATLAGTPGDDTLVVRPSDATFSNALRAWTLRGFEKLQASAGPAGSDRAFLHGTSGDDRFEARPGFARLGAATPGSEAFQAIATDFDRVFAYGNGGRDAARLAGSELEDWLRLQSRMVTVGGPSGVRGAVDFDEVFTDAGISATDVVFAPAAARAEVPAEWSGDWLWLAALGIRWSSSGFERWQVRE